MQREKEELEGRPNPARPLFMFTLPTTAKERAAREERLAKERAEKEAREKAAQYFPTTASRPYEARCPLAALTTQPAVIRTLSPRRWRLWVAGSPRQSVAASKETCLTRCVMEW